MRILITILSLSVILSNELEVEGSLKVTGGIDAHGQSVSNVGNPVLESDATNLSTVRSMLGMKPTRIYRYHEDISSSVSFTVPSNRFWLIKTDQVCMSVDMSGTSSPEPGDWNGIMFPNDILTATPNWGGSSCNDSHEPHIISLLIYEYPFNASGSDQGLEYIEP